LAATTPNPASDDVYLPFEKLSLDQHGSDEVHRDLPTPFSPPPPPIAAHSDSEPEIKLSGGDSFAGADNFTDLGGGIVKSGVKGGLNDGLRGNVYETNKASGSIQKRKVDNKGLKKKKKALAESPPKSSPSRQKREERLAKWKESRPPLPTSSEAAQEPASPSATNITAVNHKVTSSALKPTTLKGVNAANEPRKEDMVAREMPKAFTRRMDRGPTALEPVSERETWQIDKAALKAKFGDEAWSPRKRLSPDALEGIRALHSQHPEQFTTPVLADQFKVSPEAIRRILKSKWRANADEEESRRLRWDKRGEKIWASLVEKGVHAPKKWREMGIGGGPRRKAQGNASVWKASRDAQPETQNKSAGSGSSWVDSVAERLS